MVMLIYLLKRLLGMVPLLIGITLISFIVIQLAPGEPVGLETDLNPKVSAEAQERLREHYGLDKPIHVQYLNWMERFVKLDFGKSFAPDGRDVMEKVAERLPVTLWMNVIGLVIVFLIAVPLGVVSARYQDSFFDRSTTVIVFTLFAAPSFWIGLLCMMYFGVHLGWLPVSGLSSFGSEQWPMHERIIDWAYHLTLPILIGVMGSFAGLSRYMRSSMLEVIRQDFITTARAKGAAETSILYKHGLKNALLPVVTILGLSIPGLIGGSVIFESLFAIPGMGKLFYDGVMMRDYPVIMGILSIGAVLTLIGNLIADISYALVDPRIRHGKQ
ncbi:MAG: Glutathione transport system permease protein GsiC [Proteobacteria bacterium]|nr:MAG: Glutathione transport system permease protein GsiC [Pseudomonadota bacterium]